MKYRVGKSNKKALLREESGHEIALFQSEFLANRCAELLNQQSVNNSLRLYSGIMAYFIKETKFCDFVISDYKGDKVADVRREHQLLAHEIQRVLSYDIISKLSVAEIKKVTTVKTKYKTKIITQVNGEETYELYKDGLSYTNSNKNNFSISVFIMLITILLGIFLKNILLIVCSVVLFGIIILYLKRVRYEQITIPTECTHDKQKLHDHINILNQRTVKKQLKELLLTKTTAKEIKLKNLKK